MNRTRRRDERGAFLALAAVMLTMMVVVAALAIGIGERRQRLRTAHNAADAAALASVQELPSGPWQTAGVDYVERNDFSASVSAVERGEWDAGTRTFTADATGETGDCVKAFTTETRDALFGGPLGGGPVTVTADAVACRTSGGGGFPAIYGNSSTCGSTVGLNGSNGHPTVITGGIHSNTEIFLRGDVTVDGQSTYVTTVNVSNSTTWVPDDANPQQVGVKDWPDGIFDLVTSYLPGGSKYAAADAAGVVYDFGNQRIRQQSLNNPPFPQPTPPLLSGNVLRPGIYITSGEIQLPSNVVSGPGDPALGVGTTFISISGSDPTSPSGDLIRISGGENIAAWRAGHTDPVEVDDLLAFTAHDPPGGCSGNSFRISGPEHIWSGLVFTPFGQVQMTGSGNLSLSGSIVAHTVDLSGSEINITSVGDDVNAVDEYELVD